MKKKIITLFVLATCFLLISLPALAASTNRLAGEDRYKTAEAIAKETAKAITKSNTGKVDSVVLVPGDSFANALPAGVLAAQKNAPIILVGKTTTAAREYFDFIWYHMNKTGTVYIVADKNTLQTSDFITNINKQLKVSTDIKWISGTDKYDTSRLTAEELNVATGTPVVISSGENFPDALAVSGYASREGYPIILVKPDSIDTKSLDYIKSIIPNTIFITGGTGAVSAQVEATIKNAVPNADIKRFAGNDRFDTASRITNYFTQGKSISEVYVTSGMNYPDALAGSVLVAKNQGALVLVDPKNPVVPDAESPFLRNFNEKSTIPMINIFGGTGVVPDQIVTNINRLIMGDDQKDSEVAENGFLNETFNGTYIDYDNNLAVILPGNYDGPNKTKLTPKTYTYENTNAEASFSVVGEIENLTFKFVTVDMHSTGKPYIPETGNNMGAHNNEKITVKYDKSSSAIESYKTILVEGDVVYPNGYVQHISFYPSSSSKVLLVPKKLPF